MRWKSPVREPPDRWAFSHDEDRDESDHYEDGETDDGHRVDELVLFGYLCVHETES